ncbi:MAG: 6-phosphofructokinase [candidate division WS1 bacterium]|nr:6-phosphofructokinase [candidate division WS1 bacterium]
MAKSKTKRMGILTAGGDCPGLNAAIRGVAKAARGEYGIEVVGIYDGFQGLIENRWRMLDWDDLSGILTIGGTMLRTSRTKPHKYELPDGETIDMTAQSYENYKSLGLDCLVILGGGGTQKNALKLVEAGCNVITLPKTIDNDIAGTDVCFGYDTAVTIGTEAVDRLHSTADSHKRIMVLELMGNKSGWLALGAGVAGGADAILIPEIPFEIDSVAASIGERDRRGKRFSIVAVAEGAEPAGGFGDDDEYEGAGETHHVATRVGRWLEGQTGLEARVTILGYVQRGGSPTAADRLLATKLGTAAADLLAKGRYNVMVGSRGESWQAVPLEEVAGERRTVPPDHDWIRAARRIGTSFGDE